MRARQSALGLGSAPCSSTARPEDDPRSGDAAWWVRVAASVWARTCVAQNVRRNHGTGGGLVRCSWDWRSNPPQQLKG